MQSLKIFMYEVNYFIGELTDPMRRWKHGEDGKFIYMMIGAIATLLLVLHYIRMGYDDLSYIQIILYSFFIGLLIEAIQIMFLNQGTKKERSANIAWIVFGGATVGLYAIAFGGAKWIS